MITYKIRDKEKNKYRDDMIADSEWYIYSVYRDWYWLQCLTTTDQSRYTIEREISDDVIYNIRDEYTTTSKWWNSWKILLDIFRRIFRENINQKTS